MTHHVWTPGVTNHFVERAVERIGCTADEAREIGQGIIWAVENGRGDLAAFVVRVNREGHRIFRFRYAASQRVWYALVNTSSMVCVTVLPAGSVIPCQGQGRFRLKEEGV